MDNLSLLKIIEEYQLKKNNESLFDKLDKINYSNRALDDLKLEITNDQKKARLHKRRQR